jgi:predicted nucleic acid-binding protein
VIVISDTSAITNLAAIGHLQLLPQLYNQVTIPEAVYRELVDIDPPVPGTLEVQTSCWLEVRQVANRKVVERLQNEVRLDPGESEAIALALDLGAELLLIDERRGRAEANRLGLRITGLLGILIEAKQRNLIVAVKPLMDALIATSEFRVSLTLYTQILEMVDEAQ